jgi:hypothetical protein
MRGTNPRTRKSIATFAPTKNPIPIACSAITVGNASSEEDSRTHTLSQFASTAVKKLFRSLRSSIQ